MSDARVVVEVEPWSPADFPRCADLMAGSDPWITLGVGRAAALAAITAAPGDGFVAREAPSAPACGFVRYEPRGFLGRHGYVRTLAVAPERRALGLGARLLARAEGAVFAAGAHVFLLCSTFNPRAQAFYAAQGYQRVGEIPAFVVPRHGEVLFYKLRPDVVAGADADAACQHAPR